ncbi:hypothetical protein [Quadrisphaera sp. KR29]|uniref:hypothetical protein n=1 Tax=Quadrisphaera sp. KR29 TaxID=3461391 RepID=UPI004043DF53
MSTAPTLLRAPAFDEPAFAALLARASADAVQREQARTLLGDQLGELRALGFGALAVPVEHGGHGASFHDVLERVVRLSAADASLGHVWRGHIAFAEALRLDDPAHASRWYPRLVRGDFVGNAQSERQPTAKLEARVLRGPDGVLRLTGRKYYTTGSIYADWIHVAALDDDGERVSLTVGASRPEVTSTDDWDGFGQLLTGSGTTVFDAVPVDPREVRAAGEEAERWHHLGSVFQLCLLAVVAGVAQRALEDTTAFVRGRRRTFGFAGETLPREDALVQLVVGELSSAASAARRLVLSVARDVDAAVAAPPPERREALAAVQREVFRAQDLVPRLVLDASTRLFEVGGASALSTGAGLDRHWRNVRTVASHNPAMQRTRAVGLWELSGELPDWKAPGR